MKRKKVPASNHPVMAIVENGRHRLVMLKDWKREDGKLSLDLFATEDASGYAAFLARAETWARKTLADAGIQATSRGLGTAMGRKATPEYFAARLLFFLVALKSEHDYLTGRFKPRSKPKMGSDPEYRPEGWNHAMHAIGLGIAIGQEAERMGAVLDLRPLALKSLERSDSAQRAARSRFADVKDRNARWQERAIALRAAHPTWSNNDVANQIFKGQPNTSVGLRTILNAIKV